MVEPLVEQFQKNHEYNYWANHSFLKALEEMAQPPEKAVKIFAHILFAVDVWLARLKKEDLSSYTNPHPSYTLAECRAKLEHLHQKTKEYLTRMDLDEVEKRIAYTNTKGKPFEMTARAILMHMVNHSHYHRGQLAMLIAQGGGNRPETDYSAYAFQIDEAKSL